MLPIKNLNIKDYMKNKDEQKKKAASASQQSLANSLVAQNLAGMNGNVSQQIQQTPAKH